jgi:hypothetical protein
LIFDCIILQIIIDADWSTRVLSAICGNDIDTVTDCFTQHTEWINATMTMNDGSQLTPLMYAVQCERVDVVKYLLTVDGVDVNKCALGVTNALMLVSVWGMYVICVCL